MTPGRELDAMVWQALNGQEVNIVKCRYVDDDWQPYAGYPLGHVSPPHYSTDIAAAMEVWEKLPMPRLLKEDIIGYDFMIGYYTFYPMQANSLAHAICLAALAWAEWAKEKDSE